MPSEQQPWANAEVAAPQQRDSSRRRGRQSRAKTLLCLWLAVAAGALWLDRLIPGLYTLPSGLTLPVFILLIAAVMAASDMLTVITQATFRRRGRPPVEGAMLGNIYRLVAGLGVLTVVVYGFGALKGAATIFAMFGGMLLGWSLQAPVSGFAAWVLVSLKRPFRPGDRIQFPNLGLVGDVKEIGAMYTVLDQVGGTIGSEEAVGRHILVPNAMLFGQVVINYTVQQEAAYMLDEVVIRITYDSDWAEAERILLDAAREVTSDIIEATGMQPYIRSDLWEYGVFVRLRYQTRVKDRPEVAYRLTKSIFEKIQQTPSVDIAIPFVYSYRSGLDRRRDDEAIRAAAEPAVQDIEIGRISAPEGPSVDEEVMEELAKNITEKGLLQPVVVVKRPGSDTYELLAGHLRLAACRKLGWKTIPAVVKGSSFGQ